MQYTRDQVLSMAPDEASAKAGQQLASHAKWIAKSVHGEALWGECQGSGKTPYETIVDLGNIAFKCSCPSRKFPCKHGLGLMLLYTGQPDVFTRAPEMPGHVSAWLGRRQEKEVAREQREAKPADGAAQAKRAASREKKVDAGIEELRAWIKDVVRTGIMDVPQDSYRFNRNITARMVDAQASGLAGQLRQIDNIDFHKEGWQRALVKKLAVIYLITEAYRHRHALSQDMVQELQALIGWTTPKEEVLKGSAVSDTWVVLSVTTTEDGNISTERIWLYGKTNNRFALVLNFYAGNQLPQHLLFPGLHLAADIVYFPGVAPIRALISESRTLPQTSISLETTHSVVSVFHRITSLLAQNPFTEQVPFLLDGVQVVSQDGSWLVSGPDRQGCTIANPEEACWRMLAFTNGKPCSCFGVYENEQFHVHTLWANYKTCFVK